MNKWLIPISLFFAVIIVANVLFWNYETANNNILRNLAKEEGTAVGYQNGFTEGEQVGYATGIDEGNKTGYVLGYETGKDEGFSIGYNSGNETGYTSGYSAGYQTGNDDGYTRGNESGYNSGYAIGHSDGDAAGFDRGNISGYNKGYSVGNTAGQQTGFIEGNTSGFEQGLAMGHNKRDPTYAEMMAFINEDTTDENIYSDGFGWLHFSLDTKINAYEAGYLCGLVYVDMPEYVSTCVCFQTTDKGLIFIDPQMDVVTSIVVGGHFVDTTIYQEPDYDDTILSYDIIW